MRRTLMTPLTLTIRKCAGHPGFRGGGRIDRKNEMIYAHV